jgi:hypothetical protein
LVVTADEPPLDSPLLELPLEEDSPLEAPVAALEVVALEEGALEEVELAVLGAELGVEVPLDCAALPLPEEDPPEPVDFPLLDCLAELEADLEAPVEAAAPRLAAAVRAGSWPAASCT